MKKIISQISIVLLIMIIGMVSVFITEVNADSKAGINCPTSVKLGANFSVSLNLPTGSYAAESTITVKFSDGTTSTARIAYIPGMSENKVTFNAKVAGTATVTASAIIISDARWASNRKRWFKKYEYKY